MKRCQLCHKPWNRCTGHGRGTDARTPFQTALCLLPNFLAGSFDPQQHKTVADLRALAQHELDLHDEGEVNDLDVVYKVHQTKWFIKRCETLQESK